MGAGRSWQQRAVTDAINKQGQLYHRSLYTWKSVSSLREEFFLQDESSFESNTVTKPVVTQATTRHQMKDMDIIFPLIPLNFLWVK